MPSEPQEHASDRLDGWKEISGYLRCDVRTCLRWEKWSGLPVHRINKEAKRSKVVAFRSELDLWMAGDRQRRPAAADQPRAGARWSMLLAGVGVLVLAAVAWAVWPASSGPVAWKVRGKALVFYDTQDRELWSRDIDAPSDSTSFFDDGDRNPYIGARTRVVLKDVDGDGRNEVAFFDYARRPAQRAVVLVDHEGTELWRQRPLFEARYRTETPGPSFRPYQLDIEDVDGDGRMDVLALWGHDRYHPGLLQIFSLSGRRMLQYEHTGVLQSFAYRNEGETVRQILLGGTNSLVGGDAVLAVLDTKHLRSGLGPPYDIPGDLRSRSSELARFVPVGATRAGQLRYLRFSHNELSRANDRPWLNVFEMLATADDYSIQVDYGSNSPAYFKFDRDFNVLGVQAGSDFRRCYATLFENGTLTTALDDFLEERRNSVLQWDGTGWTPVPVRR